MKILQISTPVLPISPNMNYGGTERVIRDLDAEYVNQGHESLVVAPGNSIIKGRLIPTISQNTWKPEKGGYSYNIDRSKTEKEFEAHCKKCLEIIALEKPDAVHDHTKLITSQAYFREQLNIPILTTFHGNLDDRSFSAIDKINKIKRKEINYFGAISQSQKKIFKNYLNLDFVVYNAIKSKDYPFQAEKRDYLFAIGKIDRNKGQDISIKVAKKLGKKLVIAGPVHSFRNWIREYWENEVKPNIDAFYKNIPAEKIQEFVDKMEKSDKQIIYVGEINDKQKQEWFKYANGFLMPIRWDEPFGLVIIESMACGTPVVAYNRGAIPEIILDKKTGYIVEPDNFEKFLEATLKLNKINPYDCRNHVEKNFDVSRQAKEYIEIFKKISKINQN